MKHMSKNWDRNTRFSKLGGNTRRDLKRIREAYCEAHKEP